MSVGKHLRSMFDVQKESSHLTMEAITIDLDEVQIKPLPRWEYVEWLESLVMKMEEDGICPDCGGQYEHGCASCYIDWTNK